MERTRSSVSAMRDARALVISVLAMQNPIETGGRDRPESGVANSLLEALPVPAGPDSVAVTAPSKASFPRTA